MHDDEWSTLVQEASFHSYIEVLDLLVNQDDKEFPVDSEFILRLHRKYTTVVESGNVFFIYVGLYLTIKSCNRGCFTDPRFFR
jgi:hypothetical protein